MGSVIKFQRDHGHFIPLLYIIVDMPKMLIFVSMTRLCIYVS